MPVIVHTLFAIYLGACLIIFLRKVGVASMGAAEKKRSGNSILRVIFVGISLLLQVGWMLVTILELNRYSTPISLMSSIIASIVVLRLYSKNTNSAFRMPWSMLSRALPVMGLGL